MDYTTSYFPLIVLGFRVHFGESLAVRLYSEIDHLHLSIEAQCVIALLPLGDCHTKNTVYSLIRVSLFYPNCTEVLNNEAAPPFPMNFLFAGNIELCGRSLRSIPFEILGATKEYIL